ncbi:MAG: molybdopterin-dependent oxidoreductase [Methanoregulaceae archaeon]
MEFNYIPTTCPYCGTGCGINLVVKDKKVAGISPWHRSPINEGKLCIRGNKAYEFVNAARLTTPLIRKDGKLEPASWDEAFSLIASKLGSVKGEDVLVVASSRVTNEDNFAAKKFAETVLKTRNIDASCRFSNPGVETALTGILGSSSMTNSIEGLTEAKCIFVTSNPVEENPLVGRRIIQAQQNGAKVITASWRRHATAKDADLHLQAKPGTQVALFNAILNVILKNGWENKDFVAKHTKDFEKVKAVASRDDYSPEKAERITGVPAKDITTAAEWIAKSGATAFVSGISAAMNDEEGAQLAKVVANLALATGSFGKAGTGLNMLRGLANLQGAADLGLVAKAGITVPQVLDGTKTVKALYVIGENPVKAAADAGAAKKALSAMDFIVVQDMFLTETAELASVVLPSAAFAEKDGTQTNSDRHVQRVRKAVDAPGEAKADWQILADLAKKMGHEKEFAFGSSEEIFSEIAKAVPSYAGITYAKLEKPEAVQAGGAILYADKFATQDGKAVFSAVEYQALPEESGFPFLVANHWSAGTLSSNTPSIVREFNGPAILINSEDAKALGISTGSVVTATGKNGAITLPAKVTKDILKGVVEIPAGINSAAVKLEKVPEAN